MLRTSDWAAHSSSFSDNPAPGLPVPAARESDAAAAAAAAASAGGKYEDPAFAPGPSSLWRNGTAPAPELGIGADPVGSWRRPEEFAPNAPVMFHNDYSVEGIIQGAGFDNRWFISALSIVAGNRGQLDRIFFGELGLP